MASRIQGITVEIGGDTTKLSKALESVNKSIKGTQSGLKDVNKLLKLDPSNVVMLSTEGDVLGSFSLTLKVERAAINNGKIATYTFVAFLKAVRDGIRNLFIDKAGCFGFESDDGLGLSDRSESSSVEKLCREIVEGSITEDGYFAFETKYCILAYPCQVRRVSRHTFAYRKTAVQVSPYGGRLFICRTSRCVCRCGPASAPEHHPLCDRQAASPGEYDIPDDLPNRRTGHGHGSYPAAVRPLPAMLRPAPAARSSSHA